MINLSPTLNQTTHKEFSFDDFGFASPFEIYRNLYNSCHNSFLFESVKGPPKTARFSFIGCEPFLTIKSNGYNVEIKRNDSIEKRNSHPFLVFRELLKTHSPLISVGYFSYDLGWLFEKLPQKNSDDLDLPDLYFMFFDNLIVFDHLQEKARVFGDYPAFFSFRKDAKIPLKSPFIKGGLRGINLISNTTQKDFMKIVKKAKKYIKSGDIYQVNLSQRFEADLKKMSILDLYTNLRTINPSPFGGIINFGDFQLVSSSPERLLKIENGIVETRPIAGTRPRGQTFLQDMALAEELILNEKERAEHIMLVDLERNDLGRICEFDSISVDELMTVEDYSHVFHIVSNVQGKLKNGVDVFDVIASCFPGGTITGCPKIRSMEIIEELENVKRGPYTGSMGYILPNGNADLNIIIRTFVIKNNKAYIQVGAGIVADSDPEREYYETLYKGQALFSALSCKL